MPREFLFKVMNQDGKGDIPLEVVEFTASEYLSKPFNINVKLASSPNDPNVSEIEFDDVIAQPALLTITDNSGNPERYFHGKIRKFMKLRKKNTQYIYRAIMVPEMWKLSLMKNSRIFHDSPVLKTNPGANDSPIVQTILDEGVVTHELLIQNTYNSRDYCAQYKETTFNFISRLLEEEGVFYFFKHLDNSHNMVLGDSDLSYQDLPADIKDLDFLSSDQDSAMASDTNYVYNFRLSRQIHSGKVSLKDFDFKEPSTPVPSTTADGTSVGLTDHGAKTFAEWEAYDYPGGYISAHKTVPVYDNNGDPTYDNDGKPITTEEDNDNVIIRSGLPNARLQAASVKREMGNGKSVCPGLLPGYKFKLIGHSRYKINDQTPDEEEYVLTQVIHKGTQPQTLGEQGNPTYFNKFQVIPSSVTFRPKRKTLKAIVRGPQTAIVVDASGEIENPGAQTAGNVDTDDYGRVRVRFHWERPYKDDEDNDKWYNTAWVRVSQTWAGQDWGSMHMPHVGNEVIVDFLEGDPDRPIITGRVYNGENQPFDPPQNDDNGISMKPTDDFRKSGFRDEAGNFMIFDATEGQERVSIYSPGGVDLHAEEGFSEFNYKNNYSTSIGNSFESTLGMSGEALVGLELGVKAANSYEAAMGQVFEFFAGHKSEIGLGVEYEWKKMKDLKEVDADIKNDSSRDHILTAGDGFCIAGGVDEKNEIGSSIFNSCGEGLMLSFGENDYYKQDLLEQSTSQKVLAWLAYLSGFQGKSPSDKAALGVAYSVFGVTCISAIVSGIMGAHSDAGKGQGFKTAEDVFNAIIAFSAVVQGAVSTIIGFAAEDTEEPTYHSVPKNVIGMNEGGITLCINPTFDTPLKKEEDLTKEEKKEYWKETALKSTLAEDTETDSKILMAADGSIDINSNGEKKDIKLSLGDNESEIALEDEGIGLRSGGCYIAIGKDDDIEIDTSLENKDITLNAGTGKVVIDASEVEIAGSTFSKTAGATIAKNLEVK